MSEQPTRQGILAFVRAHPATSARGIQRGMHLAWGETAYHLELLLREGALQRDRAGRRDYYFLPEVGQVDRAILTSMQSPLERGILVEVARAEGLTFGEVVDRLGVSRSVVGFHMKFLVASELLRLDLRGGVKRYVAPRGDLVLRLYGTFRNSFEETWADRFAETWSGFVRD